jgi:hypothetical protein
VPSFATFGSEMHSRLLQFFDESVIRQMLEKLRPGGAGGGAAFNSKFLYMSDGIN